MHRASSARWRACRCATTCGAASSAFALKEVRDTDRSILAIALDHGFSSHEAFTRAFKAAYGLTPSAFRARPRPVVLRTKLTLVPTATFSG